MLYGVLTTYRAVGQPVHADWRGALRMDSALAVQCSLQQPQTW